jgi:hypothetical protein
VGREICKFLALLPDRLYVWWTVRDDTNRSDLGAKLRSILETHGLPFLEPRVSSCSARGLLPKATVAEAEGDSKVGGAA